jgi:hypothetical protein
MDTFTLEEAQRWVGHTVIAKTDSDADCVQIAAEQQGTVIGIHGEYTVQGAQSCAWRCSSGRKSKVCSPA